MKAEHLTLAELLGAVEVIDAHIDASAGPGYRGQPLALRWARVTKCCEEAGELWDAWYQGTLDEALGEAGDVISAALCAIQHLTKDTSATWAVISAAVPGPHGGPLTIAGLLGAVGATPAAHTWARVTAPCGKAGRVWAALSRQTGENYRKGACGTEGELLAALGEVAWSGLLAIQHLTGDTGQTWAVVSAAFIKALSRVPPQRVQVQP